MSSPPTSAPPPVFVHTEVILPGIVGVRAAVGALGGFAVGKLGSALDAALARSPWGVVLDLRPVDMVTPAGMAMLVRVAVAAGERDVGLRMVCPDVVRDAAEQLGLTRLFDIDEDLDFALGALGVAV